MRPGIAGVALRTLRASWTGDAVTLRTRGARDTLHTLNTLNALHALHAGRARRADTARATCGTGGTRGASRTNRTRWALEAGCTCRTSWASDGRGGALRASWSCVSVSASGASQALRASGAHGADDLSDVIPRRAVPYVEVAVCRNDVGVVDCGASGQITNSSDLSLKCDGCTLWALSTRGASGANSPRGASNTLRTGRADGVRRCARWTSGTNAARRASGACHAVEPGVALRTSGADHTLDALRTSVALHTLHTLRASGAEGSDDSRVRTGGASGAHRAEDQADAGPVRTAPDVKVAVSSDDVCVVNRRASGQIAYGGNLTPEGDGYALRALRALRTSGARDRGVCTCRTLDTLRPCGPLDTLHALNTLNPLCSGGASVTGQTCRACLTNGSCDAAVRQVDVVRNPIANLELARV